VKLLKYKYFNKAAVVVEIKGAFGKRKKMHVFFLFFFRKEEANHGPLRNISKEIYGRVTSDLVVLISI